MNRRRMAQGQSDGHFFEIMRRWRELLFVSMVSCSPTICVRGRLNRRRDLARVDLGEKGIAAW